MTCYPKIEGSNLAGKEKTVANALAICARAARMAITCRVEMVQSHLHNFSKPTINIHNILQWSRGNLLGQFKTFFSQNNLAYSLVDFTCLGEMKIITCSIVLNPWTNFSLQDEPWAEFTTLDLAACVPCTYCPV